ncbi:hypothetical protein A2W14_03020 [Candidatus Gottesmanbacteria bacterium RBG_16_37_8]|uniref:Phosphatidate cytidylyltransferase n=1 Tax=Candidatus Gottesmanbacteria bacterium RBG_16_37_8 TaxID=1798371 RepID=A0A1F5YTJ9_9BACT|nr:MAG: hypothetical protein A2W14_03020 [Candidatus Gottesmanbacteria bacterium RBG_16_37_8]
MYLIVLFSYILLFLLVETIKRKSKCSSEITRKILHVFSGIGVIYWSNYLTKNEFIFVTCIFLFLFIINLRKKMLHSLIITNRKTYGEVTYLLGLLIYSLLLYSQRNYFILGILVLMLPDAIAGLANHFLNKPYKEMVHIFSYALLTFLITILFLPLHLSLLFVLILTFVEFYSSYGLDNFTVPLAFSLVVRLFL